MSYKPKSRRYFVEVERLNHQKTLQPPAKTPDVEEKIEKAVEETKEAEEAVEELKETVKD